jgi:AraC-like DNA-binding protein
LKEYVYSPHYDFYVSKVHRNAQFDMKTFHLHKKYEIYYLSEGTRRYFIEDFTYLVNTGNVVLVDKDEIHKTGPVGREPHTRFVVNFNPAYLNGIWGTAPVEDLLAIFRSGIKVLVVNMKTQGFVENTLQKLYDLSGSDLPESDMLRKSLLTELLICLKGCTEEQLKTHIESPRITNKTVDKITAFISENYREQLCLKEIAARFYISPCYLSHLFKKSTSLSVMEYLNSVRIREAKKYLETTNLKISEISNMTGFATSAHFSRMFKLGTGLSPKQYRIFYKKE